MLFPLFSLPPGCAEGNLIKCLDEPLSSITGESLVFEFKWVKKRYMQYCCWTLLLLPLLINDWNVNIYCFNYASLSFFKRRSCRRCSTNLQLDVFNFKYYWGLFLVVLKQYNNIRLCLAACFLSSSLTHATEFESSWECVSEADKSFSITLKLTIYLVPPNTLPEQTLLFKIQSRLME